MHKKVFICIASIVVIAAIAILGIYGYLDVFNDDLDGEFSVEDSSMFEAMANHDSAQEDDLYLGRVDDISALKRQAQRIWIKKYGTKVRSDRPYRVFYDPSYDIYYVTGTVKGALGGTANMFVKGDTGLVLSVWHDK